MYPTRTPREQLQGVVQALEAFQPVVALRGQHDAAFHGSSTSGCWTRSKGTADLGAIKPVSAPFTDADVKRIAALPAAEQIEEVRKELKTRNPEFVGKFDAVTENDQVVGLDLTTDGLTDLSPVRAFSGLQRLTCAGLTNGTLTDLGPLRGLPLRVLEVHGNGDLTDLTPLAGMKLELLNLWGWGGSDLSALKGMPLTELFFEGAAVTDLAVLEGLPLKKLSCDFRAERDAEILRAIATLEEINGVSAEKFWKDADEKDKKP